MTATRRQILLLLIILAAAAALLTANLGQRLLWQDEAEVALLARSIDAHGVPTAWDGRNIITQQNGTEFDDGFTWRWSAWGGPFIVWASTTCFGQTPFGFRFPGALFGWLTILITFFMARRWTGRTDVALLSCTFLLLNIPFLLHARQCRYYSIISCLGITMLWTWRSLPNRRAWIALTLCGAAMFYVNELALAALMGPLLVYAIAVDRHRRRIRWTLSAIGAMALIGIPEILMRTQASGAAWHTLALGEAGLRIGKGLFEWNNVIFPAIALALILVFRRHLRPATEKLAWLMLCALALFPLLMTPFLDPNIRYATYGFPLAALLIAAVTVDVWRWRRPAAVGIAAILLGTNLVAIGPIVWLGRPLKSEIVGFAQEITEDYRGPTEAIVALLNDEAKPDDVLLATYGQLPLMLHTPLRIANMLPSQRAEALGLPRFTHDPMEARWFIPRNTVCRDCPPLDPIFWKQHLEDRGATLVPFALEVEDLKYGNSPNITSHRFTSPHARADEGLIIYRIDWPEDHPVP